MRTRYRRLHCDDVGGREDPSRETRAADATQRVTDARADDRMVFELRLDLRTQAQALEPPATT
jgi:hypothetical protein